MQEDGFSHSDLYRRACRAHERKLRGAIEQALRSRAGRARRRRRRRRALRELHRRDPLRPGHGLPRQRAGEARHASRGRRDAARGDPRRRHRLDARRHARRSRRSARAACAGFEIEVLGTDPDVDRRLLGGGRVRGALLPGPADRRAQPARRPCRRSPTAASTLIHVCSPGPRRHRRRARQPRPRRAAARQLPHRADRLRRPALGRAARRAGDGARRGHVLRRVRPRALPQPGLRRDARRHRRGRREGRALGPRRRHRALRSRAARGRPARTAARGEAKPEHSIDVLYAGRITREKGADLLADAFLRHGRASRGCAWCSSAAGPSRSACASASARRRHFLGWLDGERSRAPTRAPTSSSSPAAPTPSARSCSRRRPAVCRSSPSPRAARCR